MYAIGQKVKCGGISYEIIDISPEPYLRFDDGTMHYVMSLRRCGGKFDDVLIINDAQLESEESEWVI